VPGQVWVDTATEPTLAVAQIKLRCFIGGSRAGSISAVRDLLADSILPATQAAGLPGVIVHASTGVWAAGLEAGLRDLLPKQARRDYYQRRVLEAERPAALPAGFTLRAADATLLAEPHLAGLDELRAEMCSERESVAAFLAESFGVCALQGDTLAGWCLSEYNLDDRCEVGIATAPPFQRQGLATALAQAFLAAAFAQGIRQVGWHCWASNTASAATALRAGFTLAAEEVVRMRWW
jgi:GNAT superfamily N-acetyltransferase